MSSLQLEAPERLWWLLVVPALLLAVRLARSAARSRQAVRFTGVDVLADAVLPHLPVRDRLLRHLPAGALLLTLTAATAAWAGPSAEVEVPRARATVVLALDVSLSMQATDVSPDRLTAAKAAAVRFVQRLPEGFHVGLVSFAGTASLVVPPTTDHDAVTRAVDGLSLGPSTAIGDAVLTAVQAAQQVGTGAGAPPAYVVLLSDGANTSGRSLGAAVDGASAAAVPVTTIAYGTPDGVVVVDGQRVPVPVDGPALADVAGRTGGTAHAARDGDELAAAYDAIRSRVGTTTERRDVSDLVAVGVLAGCVLTGVATTLYSPRAL